MKKTLSLSLLLLGTGAMNAQSAIWSAIDENAISISGKREIVPDKYKTYHLDMAGLKNILSQAPADKTVLIKSSPAIILLPLPDGSIQRFHLVESPVMAPALQSSYPDIRTYSVHGIDDPYASGKLDLTEYGFHGMIRSPYGDSYIDPYCKNNLNDYISYYTADFNKPAMFKLPEAGLIVNDEDQGSAQRVASPMAVCAGSTLRTYRLAVGCTGEYAIAATGNSSPTVAQTLAKVVTTVNRVDGVYETEVAVKLELVPTTTLVLYTTPGTGYTTAENNSSFSLISKSQSLITSQVGSANFDIGHTFSTGGGGLANLRCVCSTNSKASGITGSPNPVGDPYDIDYVAHEMGHQFGGNHTFNANSGAGSCSGNRNASTSVEPGSGVTIMAYAGICGSTNDLAAHSIAYFHGVSYDEITNFINGSGNACAATSTTGNNPPVVTVTPTLTSAANTPFTLTGSATDPDGDALTYQWEEIDPGSGSGGNWNSGGKPFFRSYAPVTSPSRSFPSAAVIASGNLQGTRGEYMPTTAQVLKFRLTVRDNKMGGGGVCTATTQVTITPNDVGVKQYTGDNFTISFYPNPFSGQIKVEIAGTTSLNPENTSLKVYDVLGNVVKTEKLKIRNNYSESFDLSHLANGSYMIEVTDGQQRSVTRVVKM